MDDRPLLSVIVPAWNVGPSLERAVRSALAEPVNLEVVVVDDGSTDDTLAVARAIAAGDPRVVVVAQPANAGVSEARNIALERARGTWLTFLDADDVLLPGGLVALLTAAERDDALVVVGQRRWSDGERTWRSAAYDIPDVRRPGRGSLASRPDLVAYASATGKLFAAELVSGLRFRGRILGDQPWTVRALIRAGDRLTVIDDDVYLWLRPLPGTISASLTASKVDASGPATEAVRVAIGALAEVTAEASQIADPSTRRRVVGAYFERLIRSDFAGPVERALHRGDHDAPELFAALADFIAQAPDDLVVGSPGIARTIVGRTLRHWTAVREPGRSAFWSLLADLLARDPGLPRRAGGPTPLWPALALARRAPRSRRLAEALILAAWPFWRFGPARDWAISRSRRAQR